MTKTPPCYLIVPCETGIAHKVDISRMKKSKQKQLQQKYAAKPAPIQDFNWTPHNCPDCGQACKSPNGYGTAKAEKLTEIDERRQKILLAIEALGQATVRQIDDYLLDRFNIPTTENATHSRISDLVRWQLVYAISVDGNRLPADIYPDTKAAKYEVNIARLALIRKYNYETWILRAIDNGLSFTLG